MRKSDCPKPARNWLPLWVFMILLASCAYFRHRRDWNTASRLMLTYAIVDRGTVCLDGLEDQTRDLSVFQGRHYSDKSPGGSLLGVPAYALAKAALGLPDHPLNRKGFAFWPADPWTTLGSAGLATAAAGALLTWIAARLGCGPGRSALIGLAYGLATPAYVYGTLDYGHQPAAFALLASFTLIWTFPDARRSTIRGGWAGFFAACAVVIELQVAVVAAVLGAYLLWRVARREADLNALFAFAIGGVGPALVLAAYNQLAFGSPWQTGYFHLANQFSAVHDAKNPLGLNLPRRSLIGPLLWEGRRGLLRFAPILLLAPAGWVALARRHAAAAVVTVAACLAVFLVNLSYSHGTGGPRIVDPMLWTGGMTTGPRILVPILPFAMIPVASLLAATGRKTLMMAVLLALAGWALMLLFQGVGGRVPHTIDDPLRDAVLPLWSGAPLDRSWVYGDRFTDTIAGAWRPEALAKLPETRRWAQFAPLVAFQAVAIGALLLAYRPRGAGPPARSD